VNNNIRLFTGLAIPDHVRSGIRSRISAWKNDFPFERWSHPEDWHITLHFIGSVEVPAASAIRKAIEETAKQIGPFRLSLSRLGIFGNPRRPSILWLGLEQIPPQLHTLHAELGAALHRTIGFVPEDRPFHPHLTIARKFSGTAPFNGSVLPALEPGDDWHQWTADEIVLFRSHLGRSPMYEQTETAKLSGVRESERARSDEKEQGKDVAGGGS
jgi:2'-5' RNA ligase